MRAAGFERLRIGTILLAAFALRAWGAGFGLPHVYHQDEPILVHHVLAMASGEWGARFFVIPPFTQWMLLGLYAAVYAGGLAAGAWRDAQGFAALFLTDPSIFYLSGRLLLGAFCGTAAVWVVYRVGRRFFSEHTGWVAAACLALAPAHVQHGHYLYADVPLTLAGALIAHRALALVRRPTVRRYVQLGAVIGWAASIKYTALYFAPALLALQFAVYGENLLGVLSLRRIAWAALACVAAFAACAPTVWIDPAGFWTQMTHQAGAEAAVGWLHHLTYSLLGGTGWIFAACALAGLVRTPDADGRRKPVFCLFALCVSYYACVSVFSQHFARYALPLVPLLCLAAANGWRRLGRGGRVPGWARAALLVLMLTEMGWVSLRSDWLLTRLDTRDEARVWIEMTLPAGEGIAVDNRFFAPRLAAERPPGLSEGPDLSSAKARLRAERERLLGALPEPARRKYRVYTLLAPGAPEPDFVSLKPMIEADLDALRQARVSYVILNRSDSPPEAARLVAEHPEAFERIAAFSPYADRSIGPSFDPHDSTAAPHLPAELLRRERPGPCIEIYRVKR